MVHDRLARTTLADLDGTFRPNPLVDARRVGTLGGCEVAPPHLITERSPRGAARRRFTRATTVPRIRRAVPPAHEERRMSMFCYQCEQTVQAGCTVIGNCGKDSDTAALQDALLHVAAGTSAYAHRARQLGARDPAIDVAVVHALFTTVTNVNFDPERLAAQIRDARGPPRPRPRALRARLRRTRRRARAAPRRGGLRARRDARGPRAPGRGAVDHEPLRLSRQRPDRPPGAAHLRREGRRRVRRSRARARLRGPRGLRVLSRGPRVPHEAEPEGRGAPRPRHEVRRR